MPSSLPIIQSGAENRNDNDKDLITLIMMIMIIMMINSNKIGEERTRRHGLYRYIINIYTLNKFFLWALANATSMGGCYFFQTNVWWRLREEKKRGGE